MFKRDDDDCTSMLGDHLFAERRGDTVELRCDDYRPPAGEQWEVEGWEARQGVILAPANRKGWTLAYRIARKLIKGGRAIVMPQGIELELPCEVDLLFP